MYPNGSVNGVEDDDLEDSQDRYDLKRGGGLHLDIGLGGLDEVEEQTVDDVRRMSKAWVKERGTVDIMRWEGDLVDNLFDKLEQQVS